MKPATQFFATALLMCMVVACSTPTDALQDEYNAAYSSVLTSEQLGQELSAKMANSAWIERTRVVSARFNCSESDDSSLEFEITERVHKVFASDGQVYLVTGSARTNAAFATDVQGRRFRVDLAIDMPAPDKYESGLQQHMTISVRGEGYSQQFSYKWRVEKWTDVRGKAFFEQEFRAEEWSGGFTVEDQSDTQNTEERNGDSNTEENGDDQLTEDREEEQNAEEEDGDSHAEELPEADRIIAVAFGINCSYTG